MNILVVSDVDLGGEASGAERVLAAHCLGLAKRGHRVCLIAGTREGGARAAEEIGGVEIHRYRRSPASCLGSFGLFRALSGRVRFDVLVFHQPLSTFGVLLSRGSRRIPTAYVFLSPWAQEYKNRAADWRSRIARLPWGGGLLRRAVERFVLRGCQRIFVLSRFMGDRLAKEHPGFENRVALLPGGVDVERFRPPQDRRAVKAALRIPFESPLLLTVRNLEPRMGIDGLLGAMRGVKKEAGDATLIVGGEGPMERELKRLAERLGLGVSVRFEGFIPEERLPVYYQAADFFVLPTKALEGFGLVAVEALACGTPVLGTPVGAIPEILAGLGTGLLFAGTDPGAIADGIVAHLRKARAEPEGYEALRRRCRAHALTHFGWDWIVEQLEQELLSLLWGGRANRSSRQEGREERWTSQNGKMA